MKLIKENEKILDFIQSAEKLKTVKRAISISDNSRKESPAEHSWRTALLAIALHEEGLLNVNLEKTFKLITIHDLPEIITGDEWRLKNDCDYEKDLKKSEISAIDQIYASLPARSNTKLKELALEFANQTTREARVAKALDKLEVIIQRIDLGAENWERQDIFPIADHWADESIQKVPELAELWELIRKRLKDSTLIN